MAQPLSGALLVTMAEGAGVWQITYWLVKLQPEK